MTSTTGSIDSVCSKIAVKIDAEQDKVRHVNVSATVLGP